MAWTAPATWSINDVVTADDMNNIEDNLDYLKQYIENSVEVRRTSALSFSSGSYANMYWETENYDNGDLSSSALNLTAPVSGLYYVEASIQFASHATGLRYIQLIKNGSVVAHNHVPSIGITNVFVSRFVNLAVNDTMAVQARQDSGGALNVQVSDKTYFTMVLVAEDSAA